MKVGISGAGAMGPTIALTFAQAGGHSVVPSSSSGEFAAKGKAGIAAKLDKLVAKEKMTREKANEILSRIETGPKEKVADCDLVMESTTEDRSGRLPRHHGSSPGRNGRGQVPSPPPPQENDTRRTPRTKDRERVLHIRDMTEESPAGANGQLPALSVLFAFFAGTLHDYSGSDGTFDGRRFHFFIHSNRIGEILPAIAWCSACVRTCHDGGETMEAVRVYAIPKCKMVSSRCALFGDGILEEFSLWMETLPRPMFPRDFLWFDESQGGFIWYYMHHEGIEIPGGCDIVDFPGGLYAVASGIDGESSEEAMGAIDRFIQASGCFAQDMDRRQLGNAITPPEAQKAMGYSQIDYYVPIKIV